MTIAAIDIGGTFTDCVVFGDGRLVSLKVPTTPPDLERGLLNALDTAARLEGLAPRDFMAGLTAILQGTTQALNTLLTRTGARVGMITTKGFRDIIEIRRGIKLEPPYQVFLPPYEPLVPRRLRVGVAERTRYTGEIVTPLDATETTAAARDFGTQGVEAVAICFLHSYLNPANEEAARAVVAAELPGVPISVSSEVLPVWREYERFSTTAVNAYVAPRVSQHLATVEARLRARNFRGSAMLMTGGGLLESPAHCASRAVHLLGSGPAGSANAALYIARALSLPDAISIDMGGTSFDVCLVRGGQIKTTSEIWVDGHRVAVKSIDTESIGAGGGSIAWVDQRGLLRVGPQSAGAVPGPACYGGGGTEPTVTDAGVLLGYLDERTFQWWDRALDRSASEAAVARVGKLLDLDIEATAEAIFNTVNEVMANGIVKLTTQRGIDPRDFVLIAGGGAGPIHAAAIAARVGIGRIVVPSYAGVYSAFGLLACDRGVESARSHPSSLERLDLALVNRIYRELEAEAVAHLASQGIAARDIAVRRTADMRVAKQFHEVEVEVPGGTLGPGELATVVERFHAAHRELYTFSIPGEAIEVLTFRLRASCVSDVRLPTFPETGGDPAGAVKTRREAMVDGARRAVTVYDGARLVPGDRLAGPALVEERTTTVYVPPAYTCAMDRWKNYRLERVGAGTAREDRR